MKFTRFMAKVMMVVSISALVFGAWAIYTHPANEYEGRATGTVYWYSPRRTKRGQDKADYEFYVDGERYTGSVSLPIKAGTDVVIKYDIEDPSRNRRDDSEAPFGKYIYFVPFLLLLVLSVFMAFFAPDPHRQVLT